MKVMASFRVRRPLQVDLRIEHPTAELLVPPVFVIHEFREAPSSINSYRCCVGLYRSVGSNAFVRTLRHFPDQLPQLSRN